MKKTKKLLYYIDCDSACIIFDKCSSWFGSLIHFKL